MNKTIVTTLAILMLAEPLAWAEPNGSHHPQQGEEQSVTELAPQPAEQAAPIGRTRGMAISDFVTPGRSAEKDCSTGGDCHEPGKPQLEPRAPEKKCSGDSCG